MYSLAADVANQTSNKHGQLWLKLLIGVSTRGRSDPEVPLCGECFNSVLNSHFHSGSQRENRGGVRGTALGSPVGVGAKPRKEKIDSTDLTLDFYGPKQQLER
jgi:hypothetical protein